MGPAELMRPAVSGTIRARQTKKHRDAVSFKQWIGFMAVAALTTWLTRKLDDVVEQRLA